MILVQEKERDDYLKEIKELKNEWKELINEEVDASKTPLRPPVHS